MMRSTADTAWQLPAMTNTHHLFACLRCRSFAEGPKLLPQGPTAITSTTRMSEPPKSPDSKRSAGERRALFLADGRLSEGLLVEHGGDLEPRLRVPAIAQRLVRSITVSGRSSEREAAREVQQVARVGDHRKSRSAITESRGARSAKFAVRSAREVSGASFLTGRGSPRRERGARACASWAL